MDQPNGKTKLPVLMDSYKMLIFTGLEALIDQHFLSERKVEFYSQALHTSLRRLNKTAREITGKTPYQLILERLASEAKILLTGSAKSIKEITYLLNFSDMAQFNKFFRKHTGKTPSQYRQAAGIDLYLFRKQRV